MKYQLKRAEGRAGRSRSLAGWRPLSAALGLAAGDALALERLSDPAAVPLLLSVRILARGAPPQPPPRAPPRAELGEELAAAVAAGAAAGLLAPDAVMQGGGAGAAGAMAAAATGDAEAPDAPPQVSCRCADLYRCC